MENRRMREERKSERWRTTARPRVREKWDGNVFAWSQNGNCFLNPNKVTLSSEADSLKSLEFFQWNWNFPKHIHAASHNAYQVTTTLDTLSEPRIDQAWIMSFPSSLSSIIHRNRFSSYSCRAWPCIHIRYPLSLSSTMINVLFLDKGSLSVYK